MELLRCHASLVKSPFEIHGIQLHRKSQPSRAVMRVNPAPQKPVGLQGIRLLSIQQKNENVESAVRSNFKQLDVSQVPLRFLTKHKRGQLLVWDGSSSEVIGSCSHGRTLVVEKCLLTDDAIYTTVENLPGVSFGGTFNVYRWNAKTLALVDTLVFPRKVEAISLSENNLVTATDLAITVWNCSSLQISPVQPLLSIEPGELGVPTVLEVHGDLAFVGGNRKLLSVFSLSTTQLLAQSCFSEGYCTSLRVMQSNGFDASTVVLTGSSDGYMMTWTFKLIKGEIKVLHPSDKQKLHPANVSDLVADKDIVLSSSPFSGAVVLHRRHRIITTLSTTPCRALMLDSDNKRIIIGDDFGCISVFNYSAYAVNGQNMELIFKCHPHNGAITGVYLQLGAGSMWERVVTCSIEGSIATLDFTEDQPFVTLPPQHRPSDLQDIVTSSLKAIAVMDHVAQQVYFFTTQFETHTDYPPLRMLGKQVAGLRWLSDTSLVVTMRTNELHFFVCELNDEQEPTWMDRGSWNFNEDDMSEPPVPSALDVSADGTILAAATTVSHCSRRGCLALLRFDGRGVTVLLHDTIQFSPVQGRLLAVSSPPTTYCCILQCEGANIAMYVVTPGQQRMEEVQLTEERTLNTTSDERVPKQFFVVHPLSQLRVAYLTEGVVQFANLDKTTLRVIRSSASIPLDDHGVLIQTNKKVIGLCMIQVGQIQAALLREDSCDVEMVLNNGTVGYHLTYEGDMTPMDPPPRRRPNSFPVPLHPSGVIARPACRGIASHMDGRYVASVYSDGLLQVFDVCEARLISRWFTRHHGTDIGLRAFMHGVMLTSMAQKDISIYLIPRRFLYDQENELPKNKE